MQLTVIQIELFIEERLWITANIRNISFFLSTCADRKWGNTTPYPSLEGHSYPISIRNATSSGTSQYCNIFCVILKYYTIIAANIFTKDANCAPLSGSMHIFYIIFHFTKIYHIKLSVLLKGLSHQIRFTRRVYFRIGQGWKICKLDFKNCLNSSSNFLGFKVLKHLLWTLTNSQIYWILDT